MCVQVKNTATSQLTDTNKHVILYLEYWINWLTINSFCEYHEMSSKRASIEINKGRMIRESDFGILASTLAVKYKVIS